MAATGWPRRSSAEWDSSARGLSSFAGISAGIGKLGAFIGVFLFLVLQTSLGLRGTLLLTAGVAVADFALTLVLPEPAGRSLEDVAASTPGTGTRPRLLADQPAAP